MLSRRPLPMQWQPRDSPISSNSTDYLARTTSAPAFQILETMPATAPRAARGRTDAAEAVGCADLAPSNLAPLTSKINPPPFAIQQHVQPAPRRKLGRWPTAVTLLAGTFWPRRLMAGLGNNPVQVFRSSFNTALQLVLRPHFLVHFV